MDSAEYRTEYRKECTQAKDECLNEKCAEVETQMNIGIEDMHNKIKNSRKENELIDRMYKIKKRRYL